MVGEFRRAGGNAAVDHRLLHVVEDSRILLSEESVRDSTLAGSTGTTDTMSVIYNNQPTTVRQLSSQECECQGAAVVYLR